MAAAAAVCETGTDDRALNLLGVFGASITGEFQIVQALMPETLHTLVNINELGDSMQALMTIVYLQRGYNALVPDHLKILTGPDLLQLCEELMSETHKCAEADAFRASWQKCDAMAPPTHDDNDNEHALELFITYAYRVFIFCGNTLPYSHVIYAAVFVPDKNTNIVEKYYGTTDSPRIKTCIAVVERMHGAACYQSHMHDALGFLNISHTDGFQDFVASLINQTHSSAKDKKPSAGNKRPSQHDD
jgi:hypothetical protein